MRLTKKLYIAMSLMITAIFILLGVFVFRDSYLRLWESCKDLGISAKYYFCEIFGIEHSGRITVTERSEIFKMSGLLPETSSGFSEKAKRYFGLLISRSNLSAWGSATLRHLGRAARTIIIFLPIVLAMWWIFKKLYGRYNTDHGKDTLPLRIFKKVMSLTYQPLKRFLLGYTAYLKESGKWKTLWLWSWVLHLNLASVGVGFISYYLYFAVSYEMGSLYGQFYKLAADL